MASQANPSSTSTPSSRAMSASNSNSNSPKLESEAEAPIGDRESPDPPKPDEDGAGEKVAKDSSEEGSGGGEGEEEGECGFCLFMKAGGCRETFTDWEKCVEEGEKNKEDIVDKCFQATSALKKCMEAHPDYYAPLLEAEAAAVKHLEAEKKEKSADQDKLGDSDKTAAS